MMKPNIGYSNFAKKEYGVNIKTGHLNDVHKKFDLITMFHALEHIPNPLKTSPLPSLPGLGQTAGLPPVVGAATVNQTFANNARFGNISPVSGLTLSEEIYLDPLGKAYRRKQRQTTNQTKLT